LVRLDIVFATDQASSDTRLANMFLLVFDSPRLLGVLYLLTRFP
jgi:hypothetical protein